MYNTEYKELPMSAAATDKQDIVSGALGKLLENFDTDKASVSSTMGAMASAQSIGQRAGGVSEADRKMIAVVAGLTGRQAKAMDAQIQQAAALGAKAAKDAGLKGALTEEQSQQIAEQVMKSLDGKHLGSQVQEKSRLFKTKAAIVGTISGAAALTAATFAVAAKPLAWATDKVFGSKINESFSVGGALKKGFLASTAVFGMAAAYDMHKRNSRNNARQAALVHAVVKGAESHASGRIVMRQAEQGPTAQQAAAVAPETPAKPEPSQATPSQTTAAVGAAAIATGAAALAAKAANPSATDVTPPAPPPPLAPKIEPTVVGSTADKDTAAKPSEPSPIVLSSDIGAALRARGGTPVATSTAGTVDATQKITEALGGVPKLGGISGGETVASVPIVSNIKPPEPAKDHAAVRS